MAFNSSSLDDGVGDNLDHFGFERIDPVKWHHFFADQRSLVYYAGGAYITTIYTLQRWMRNRKAYHLRIPLFWWNLCLGIFSICGFARMAPGFLSVLKGPDGIYNSICVKYDQSIQTGYWTIAFILSKWVELGDTVFIVLRKRPLVLLQWYHHLATMICSWVFAPYMEPIGHWYAVVNYGVHSLMYPYFALRVSDLQTLISYIINSGAEIDKIRCFIVGRGNPCANPPGKLHHDPATGTDGDWRRHQRHVPLLPK